MDWTIFAPVLARMPRAEPKAPGGRPADPPLLLRKILVRQSRYGLRDAQAQLQILDRRRFAQFLGRTQADAVPEQNPIREFREKLPRAELCNELFGAFNTRLTEQGFSTRQGQLVDASFVAAPRPRNGREEKAAITAGAVPAGWEQEPQRLAHKDLDARWTKQHAQTHYGYKDHLVADLTSKLSVRAVVPAASEHDRQAVDSLPRAGDPEIWADSASTGAPCAALFAAKGSTAQVCAQGTRGHALTQGQKRANRAKSRQRARVEPIFGFMTGRLRAMYQRVVGYARNRACIRLANLGYNMARTAQLIRRQLWGRKTPQLVEVSKMGK